MPTFGQKEKPDNTNNEEKQINKKNYFDIQ